MAAHVFSERNHQELSHCGSGEVQTPEFVHDLFYLWNIFETWQELTLVQSISFWAVGVKLEGRVNHHIWPRVFHPVGDCLEKWKIFKSNFLLRLSAAKTHTPNYALLVCLEKCKSFRSNFVLLVSSVMIGYHQFT